MCGFSEKFLAFRFRAFELKKKCFRVWFHYPGLGLRIPGQTFIAMVSILHMIVFNKALLQTTGFENVHAQIRFSRWPKEGKYDMRFVFFSKKNFHHFIGLMSDIQRKFANTFVQLLN